MRIMYIITGLNYGGAEKLLLDTCRELKRNKHDVIVIYLRTDGEYSFAYEKENIDVCKVDFDKHVWIYAIYKLYNTIMKYTPDVINTHLPMANLIGAIAARWGGTKKIFCTLHNVDEFLNSPKIFYKVYKHVYRLLINHSNNIRCIAVSNVVKAHYETKGGINSKKLDVIHNAVDYIDIIGKAKELINDIPFVEKNDYVILNIGRMVEEKGQVYLLKAMNELINKRNYRDIKCIILGEGKERDSLQAYIEENNLTSNIFLLGIRQNPYKYINRSNVFVMPSFFEGFSIAVLEAYALNKIVIASNVPGLNEIVVDKKTGLLITPRDYLEISNKIEDFYKGVIDEEGFIDNIKKSFEPYKMERYIKALEHIYNR
jgi:glycosyltransferase involved in cell wall biosynthesis